jgi:Flp pilus assembly protein TadD
LVTLGKYDKAVEDFNAALNVDSKSALAWAWLGVAYDKSGNRSKARESFQRALTLDPQQPLARQGMGRG